MSSSLLWLTNRLCKTILGKEKKKKSSSCFQQWYAQYGHLEHDTHPASSVLTHSYLRVPQSPNRRNSRLGGPQRSSAIPPASHITLCCFSAQSSTAPNYHGSRTSRERVPRGFMERMSGKWYPEPDQAVTWVLGRSRNQSGRVIRDGINSFAE